MNSSNPRRNVVTLSLVAGAVMFGMVLAGALQWTAPGAADPQNAVLSATQLASSGALARELPSFADLAQAVNPAVVSIEAATIQRGDARRRGQGQGQGQGIDPFEFFFGPRGRQQGPQGQQQRQQQQQQQPEEYRSDSGGSGFVISSDGLIVTNNHVVDGATDIKVRLGDRQYTAKVRGADPNTDLALLQIDAGKDLRYLELGDSDRLRVGDWIMVVGNPLSLDHTVTTGVVSAKGRSIGINSDASFENFIQTDAAINFGNSGGPLLNLQGQVVGIATAINSGAENIGFAVPVNTLRGILPQLREKGKVSRGYLGLTVQNLDFKNSKAFGLEVPNGALVESVTDGSPSDQAGIQHGDVIVKVDDIEVKNTRDLIDYVSSKGPNTTVQVQLLRDNKRLDRKVKLAERPGAGDDSDVTPAPGEEGSGRIDWLGLRYEDIDNNSRSEYGIANGTKGVLVTDVTASSPLVEEGIRPGMVITEVNGQPVAGVADFERLVKTIPGKQFLRLYVLRFGRNGESSPFFAVVQAP
jgi:serine protease Do